MAVLRIRYCPIDGRVTDEDFQREVTFWQDVGILTNGKYCEHCFMWYNRIVPFKAKGIYES
jgi:hypothetical protein